MTQTAAPARYSPAELACALGLFPPTAEQAAVIAAPPGPLVVIAGAGAGKTETMAARVVWLVANGYAEPGQVLGLTFTRKAAGQLLRRVRSRLARLAGIGLGCGDPAACAPVVSTYHAFAGSLLRDYGLLLPLEPDTRLLSETELWQLAFDVVSGYDGVLCTDKSPAAVTSIVVRLWGQLGEHLVDTRALRDTHVELERLVHALPAGRYQRDRGPSQWLLRMLATQTQRAELVPLLDALGERMHAGKVMDFAMQMASAARLAATSPQVGQDLRRRYRVVLLDEYQDTGHAQRVVLSSLFGGGVDDGLALTAVGDPIQSIYGWRGASATNLPRFTTDFPLSDGTPAPVLELLTSWRNPPQALRVANGISAEARRRSVAVRALRPRPDAPPGAVRCALLPDVQAEREWIADHLRMRYQRAEADGVKPPTAAVLVRRNADAAAIADTLRARGIPAEVVGLAGLLSIPEVAEVVAMLRLVADPTAGAAAMRVLTGPRWRLGARDLAALWRRALTLSGESPSTASPESIAMAASADADNPCLADAISDPGSAEGYSVAGYGRIGALAGELSALRGRLGHSLPDLVAEVRRVLGVDCEVRASAPVSGGWAGPEHLDAFADVVAGYAERASARSSEASVAGLLAYLDVAEVVENGLPPAELTVACDRVQVLTVHAAKGLEWQVWRWHTCRAECFRRRCRAAAGLPTPPNYRRCCVGIAPRPARTASPYWTRQLSLTENSCRTRSPNIVACSIGGALTRSVDCCTWPLPGLRTLCWCPATIGGPPGQSRAGHRNSCANSRTSLTVRPLPVILAESSSSGRRRPPAMSETHCVTTLSRRFGPLIRWPHVAAMWSGARRWWRRPCRPTCPEAPPTSIIPRARAMPPGPLTSMHCWLNVRTRRGEHLPVVCRTICRSAVWWSWSATRSVRGSG